MNPSRVLALALAASLAAAASADDAADLIKKARAGKDAVPAPAASPASAPAAPKTAAQCAAEIPASTPGVFCHTAAECVQFCSCACSFDPTKWNDKVKNDGSTTCPGLPDSGAGMLAPDSGDLETLPSFRYVAHRDGEKAGPEALAGLRRLEARLETSAKRAAFGYTAAVKSCYRDHREDSVPECGFVLKSAYMAARAQDPAQKKAWEKTEDPRNVGLAWPGRTSHSAGSACDLVLVDSHGDDCFDSRAGVDGAPHCALDARAASSMLDEEVTSDDVGASRLTYEAWHYEWGDGSATRCKAPDCVNGRWPVTGRP